MIPRPRPIPYLVASVLACACGSTASNPGTPDTGGTVEDTGTIDGTPDAPIGTPEIHFFTKPSLAGTPIAATKSFWADVIVVRVSGVPAHASVTLTATSKLRDGLYASSAIFEADGAGTIDTERDA